MIRDGWPVVQLYQVLSYLPIVFLYIRCECYLKKCKSRDEVIIIILYSKWWNLLCFLADKSWNGKTITKTIQVTYINYDTVISWIETLGLIHMCIGCTDYLYMYIQRLVVELNSYTLALFISERRFVMILYWVTNIP